MKILLVDDERSLLEQAKVFLERMDQDFDVNVVSSAEDALDMIEDGIFDVIVSDYQMPGTDGLEFLRILREERENDIPFIMFTGKGREEVAMEALNLGADRYLQKGGDPTSQYGVLAQAIKQEVMHYETETIRKENDERYRRLFETAQDGMLILNAETGKIKNANPYIQKILGYSKKELVGEKLWETRPFKDLFENRKGFEELVEKGYIRYEELPLKTKDWDEKPVEFVSITYQAGEEIEVQCNIRDISERKRLVDELNKRSEAMEASIDGMAILSEDEEYIYLNNAHAEIYGYDDPDELLGKTWSVLYDEEELERFKDEIMPIFWEKGRWKGEVIGKKKDGTKFPQELSLSALEDGGLICVVRDISERKEAEEREEFLHSLLRHDVKNKTQIVKGYIQLLKEYEELSDQAKGYIRKAEKATEASDKIIEKVRKLRQIERENEIEEIDIDPVLDQVLSEHENELEKEGIVIEVKTSGYKVKGGTLLEEAI
ncbi:MAG: PAS domain S-box protein, partial [Candidatus Saliniplasma sp.]